MTNLLLLASVQPVFVLGIIGVAIGVVLAFFAFILAMDYEDGMIVAAVVVLALVFAGLGVYGILYGNYLNRVA